MLWFIWIKTNAWLTKMIPRTDNVVVEKCQVCLIHIFLFVLKVIPAVNAYSHGFHRQINKSNYTSVDMSVACTYIYKNHRFRQDKNMKKSNSIKALWARGFICQKEQDPICLPNTINLCKQQWIAEWQGYDILHLISGWIYLSIKCEFMLMFLTCLASSDCQPVKSPQDHPIWRKEFHFMLYPCISHTVHICLEQTLLIFSFVWDSCGNLWEWAFISP